MKTIISTPHAPKAIGPYSQAVKVGGFIFCSGQIGVDPVTGTLVSGSIQEQTQRVMENLKIVLEAAGANLENVVKSTCYLKNMSDFALFNEVYGSFFDEAPPARETVEVVRLPKDALVEIAVVAMGTF
jgi:2-iminobutanoate/2-iminopropanoate deaminase